LIAFKWLFPQGRATLHTVRKGCNNSGTGLARRLVGLDPQKIVEDVALLG
jgi:hypothetical protein